MERISSDLKDLINFLKSHNVEFLVVGAHALAFHGFPRNTVDLDLWLRQTTENIHRLRLALEDFGIGIGDSGERQFMQHEEMLTIGVQPNQADLLAFLTGCNFSDSWQRKVEGQLAGIDVYYLSVEDYFATKRACDRPKDRHDIESLQRVLKRKQLGSDA